MTALRLPPDPVIRQAPVVQLLLAPGTEDASFQRMYSHLKEFDQSSVSLLRN